MRNHPITPVTEPLQYRAIGLVRAIYQPEDKDDCFTKGKLVDESGLEVEAVVLGRVITLMRRHLDITKFHLWVVYPRQRKENSLHLQIVGVWEPSTLEVNNLDKSTSNKFNKEKQFDNDSLPEGDEYFSIRGELIYTKPDNSEVVVKVRQKPRINGRRVIPFKLQLKGIIPIKFAKHFVSLDVRRSKQELKIENYEIISPMIQKPLKKNSKKVL